MKEYTPPKYEADAFNCPFCHAYAHQFWYNMYKGISALVYDIFGGYYRVSQCKRCEKYAIWNSQGNMVDPLVSSAPIPNSDMPDAVKELYEEARQVQLFSPRASAALLRVALEKLTEHLGQTVGDLNIRIKNLKAQGLNERIIKSLDTVRINANEGGSHAGQIDLTGKDNREVVNKLFFLMNIIVEKTISEPQLIDEQFNQLPDDKKDGIKQRDKDD